MNPNAAEKLDEDYQKIARQISQLRQATRPPEAAQHASHAHKPQSPESAPAGDCIFCKIAKKEMHARVIEENQAFIAFLDIQPKAAGHTIIVPKRHFSGMDEMNSIESSTLFDMISGISKRMKTGLRATGYSIVSANGISSGQIVPHFAVHLIPTYTHAVDIPVLNLIQPEKVPDFVMADVEGRLKKI